jgi:hypothetical protein
MISKEKWRPNTICCQRAEVARARSINSKRESMNLRSKRESREKRWEEKQVHTHKRQTKPRHVDLLSLLLERIESINQLYCNKRPCINSHNLSLHSATIHQHLFPTFVILFTTQNHARHSNQQLLVFFTGNPKTIVSAAYLPKTTELCYREPQQQQQQ